MTGASNPGNQFDSKAYIVLGSKPWNRRLFDELLSKLDGRWSYMGEPAQLSASSVSRIAPRYIFSLHWSWRVPADIINNFECVCFHMTDVPYGRGGSPLQNLIARGHRDTKLTALRMTEQFDAGSVYLKETLSLDGTAEEIYIRATRLAGSMMKRIILEEMAPVPQEGAVTNFKRRTPEESRIRTSASLKNLYDFIRMLDAEKYPRAFLDHEGFRLEFSRAALYDGRIVADVTITQLAKNDRIQK